jgi:subtilisin family serine protease
MTHVLPREYESDDLPPDQIQGYISVKGPETVFSGKAGVIRGSSKPYQGKKADRDEVERHLGKSGFTILAESPLGFSVSAPAGAYEDLSGGKIRMSEVLTRVVPGAHRYVTRIDIVGENQPEALGLGLPRSKTLKVDGIVLEKPRYPHVHQLLVADPSVFPPSSPKFHLTVPDGIATGLHSNPLLQQGLRGDGVRVVMVDTGFYKHPFFLAQHHHLKRTLTVVPGTNPGWDPVGHGTGESANIFASAPGIEFQGIRASDNSGNLVGSFNGFVKAKSLQPKPQVISCSWGSDYPYPPTVGLDPSDEALVLEIKHAIEQGIIVIFSAGNGHFGIEPQVPGVIAAGGTFMSATGSLRASNYASGYESPWFGGVKVPTVCGLVGLLPRAQYIMLPVPSGCDLDVSESQDEPDEVGDGTTPKDGWALFSGTSAAAPQLAGVAALMLAAKPNLTPAQVAEAMVKTATDVTSGTCHPRFGNTATVGPDLATGAGLVNAEDSLTYARKTS